MEPTFFATAKEFRKWLEKNHEKEKELLVGFYKVGSGKPSMTWSESVDQAICFGWIDAVRKSRDEHSYTIRFTHRKVGSIWSAINIKKVETLQEQGLMHPAGLAIYQKRQEHKSKVYSFEQDKSTIIFDPAHEKQFKANKTAWKFFSNLAPSYQRVAIWYVISAKQEATRQRRLLEVIASNEKGIRIDYFNKKKA